MFVDQVHIHIVSSPFPESMLQDRARLGDQCLSVAIEIDAEN